MNMRHLHILMRKLKFLPSQGSTNGFIFSTIDAALLTHAIESHFSIISEWFAANTDKKINKNNFISAV